LWQFRGLRFLSWLDQIGTLSFGPLIFELPVSETVELEVARK
jgi:hypothetical protein